MDDDTWFWNLRNLIGAFRNHRIGDIVLEKVVTKRCILTIGVSASGKTTWANNFIQEMNDRGSWWIDINRDDIRTEIFKKKLSLDNFSWLKWNIKWEKEVLRIWRERIFAVTEDFDNTSSLAGVVISDTNLNPKTRNWLIDVFGKNGYDIEFKFFPISYEEAVKRDKARAASVGASAIAEQIEKYWAQFGERYHPNEENPKAVIVDIDGTLAHANHRGIFRWDEVETDDVDVVVRDIVIGLNHQGYKILITSGRDEVCREKTLAWLRSNLGFEPTELFMRPTNDFRKDVIVKKEIFDNFIRDRFNVVAAIDDRPCVVRLWMSLGIKTIALGFQNKEF